MIPDHHRVWRLAVYADAVPGAENFKLCQEALADLADGEVLLEVEWLSMDPFPRLMISGGPARVPQLPLGAMMLGRGVGRVALSRHPDYPVGVHLAGELGWQDWAVIDPKPLTRVDPDLAPVRYSLGVLGPTGLAAWSCLKAAGRAAAGETVLISGAAGGVGAIAAQLARAQGCHVVAIAGGGVQIAYLRDDLGFSVADFTGPAPLREQIAALAPKGVDLFLDLVGGEIFDAGLDSLAVHGRAVLVGAVADYNQPAAGAPVGPRPNLALILKRAQLNGFLLADHAAAFPEANIDLATHLTAGSIQPREAITVGFENVPNAFAGLFGAELVGKQLVQVWPTRGGGHNQGT